MRRSEAFLAEAQRLSLTGSFSWRVATDEITWSDSSIAFSNLTGARDARAESVLESTRKTSRCLTRWSSRHETPATTLNGSTACMMPDRLDQVLCMQSLRHPGPGRSTGVHRGGSRRDGAAIVGGGTRQGAIGTRARGQGCSLGMLTASIAHEVNQPLSGIITNASTCLRMLAADPPNVDGARETARRTIRDGNRASDVIARLRALFTKKELTHRIGGPERGHARGDRAVVERTSDEIG